jgi:small multidrug resistance pump
MISWIYLAAAIVLEVAGTTCMKLSQGFARMIPSILIFVFYGLSFTVLTLALKKIDVSIAYAIWSGIGTALITVIGIIYFKEPVTLLKIVSIIFIIAGVIGLNLNEVGTG